MRVLHVITGLQQAAGTSVFCVEICQALNRRSSEQPEQAVQCTIAVIDPQVAGCYRSECLEPADVPIRSLESVLRETPSFDIIHLHALWHPHLHRAVKYAKRHRIPYVFSPHGMLTPWALSRKRLKKWTALALYQYWDLLGAALIHTTAESEADDVRRLRILRPIVVAPLGVGLSDTVPARPSRLPDVPRMVLFISRIHPKKGLLNLIDAWAKIRDDERHGNWHFIIAGPDQDGHAAEVEAHAAQMGVAGDFSLVGPVFGDRKQALLEQADLFVLPTYSENFGVVVIEALAHGVPVITTKGAPWAELQGAPDRATGNRYLFAGNGITANPGRCGWWIDIGVDPLAMALKDAMRLTDETRRTMGENGRKLVEAKYTWPAIAAKMKDAYSGLLRKSVRL